MSKERKEYDRKYEEKRAGQRIRNWTVIFYPEDLPDNWQKQVDELHIKWIEGPLHDKDVNADGTPKKTHVHTLFMFETVKKAEQVREIFADLFGESESGAIIGVAAINEKSRAGDRCAIVRYTSEKRNVLFSFLTQKRTSRSGNTFTYSDYLRGEMEKLTEKE